MTSVPAARRLGVLVINGCLPPPYGGIAKYLSVVLPGLVAEGFQVWAAMYRDYSVHHYGEFTEQGIQVIMPKKLRQARWVKLRLLFTYLPWIWRRCWRFGLPWREAVYTLGLWLPELDEVLQRHQAEIDLIHVYDAPWSQGWVGKILAERYHKPLVFTTYGEVAPHADVIELIDARSHQFRAFCAEVVGSAASIGSMTDYCASKLAFLGVDPAQVLPVHHVVGMEPFIVAPDQESLQQKYPLLLGKRLILFVGQLLPRKGPNLLVEIAGDIIRLHPDCVFAFVGPDLGLLPELQRLATENGVTERCLFTGPVGEEELLQFYHRATVFAFTTISHIECLGLTFVQAMYAHCPVVAANIAGVPEVIRHGHNGLLFTPGDQSGLRQSILQILDQPAVGQQLATQAFADVKQRFSDHSAIQQVKLLYQRAGVVL